MSRTAPIPAVKKSVKKTAVAVNAKPKTLAQAKVDFTAEGSPPPGMVGGAALPPTKSNA